jgi:betaine reductase
MEKEIKVVHFLNQFFGGIGGEEQADTPLSFQDGPVGPGVALEKALGSGFRVVLTAVCGDNHFNDHEHDVLEGLVQALDGRAVDYLVAGPAFNSGRYGYACGSACHYIADQLDIPSVTGMYEENPAVELFRKTPLPVYIFRTSPHAVGMNQALARMAGFVKKLASGAELLPAALEGHFPRGIRQPYFEHRRTPAVRAVDMLEAKLRGEPYESEIPLMVKDEFPPPRPVMDLPSRKLALITTAGVVPVGNPDKLGSYNVSVWHTYPVTGKDRLLGEEYDCIHGGIDTSFISNNPEYAVPLRVAREAVADHRVGELLDQIYVSSGCGGAIDAFRKIGREIAQAIRSEGADMAIHTST